MDKINKTGIETVIENWLRQEAVLTDIPIHVTTDSEEISPPCILIEITNIAPTDGFSVADNLEKTAQINVGLVLDFDNENGKTYKQSLISAVGERLYMTEDFIDFVNDDEDINMYAYSLVMSAESDSIQGTNYVYAFQLELIARW